MVEKVDPVLFLQSLVLSLGFAFFMSATVLWAMVECGGKKQPENNEGAPGYVSKSCNKQTGLLAEDQDLNSSRLKAATGHDLATAKPAAAAGQEVATAKPS